VFAFILVAIAAMSYNQFQSIQGPADPRLKHSAIEGYMPISRIGEIVVNSFVDTYEYAQVPDTKTIRDVNNIDHVVEVKPMFHEWAAVLPGMICLSRKAKSSTFRNYVAAETAAPIISCCACLDAADEASFFFAGVARSKFVPLPNDGIGPSVDEYCTLAIGGMATILNTSTQMIYPGDMMQWTFYSEAPINPANPAKRQKTNPRRIGVKAASAASDKIIGRALSFAKPGEAFDLLIKGA
jgi:hypothetical protein